MFPISKSASRVAMAVALALGGVAGTVALSSPAVAKDAPAHYSPAFTKIAAPLQTAMDAATKAKPDAAGIARLRGQVDQAVAAAQTPDDKLVAGQFLFQLSSLAADKSLERRGLEMMADSGKLTGAEKGKYQFFAGSAAFDLKDYAGAQALLDAAVASGYRGADVGVMRAETAFAANRNDVGFAALKQAIVDQAASGKPVPQEWYARGIQVAYKAKNYAAARDFSTAMVQANPTKDNWSDAVNIARLAGNYQAQETLDLMRLMQRTGSLRETGDYAEYLQAADARRAPGEVLKVLNEGVASGKLSASDVFVTDNKAQATSRLAADKAGLPALERDARAANASAVTVNAAADAFLSYDEAAKAEALYQVALSKPGVDNDRLLTRLGIAQFDQGKYAEAQATFAKVGGARKPIAQLWAIYAAQKAKGA